MYITIYTPVSDVHSKWRKRNKMPLNDTQARTCINIGMYRFELITLLFPDPPLWPLVIVLVSYWAVFNKATFNGGCLNFIIAHPYRLSIPANVTDIRDIWHFSDCCPAWSIMDSRCKTPLISIRWSTIASVERVRDVQPWERDLWPEGWTTNTG